MDNKRVGRRIMAYRKLKRYTQIQLAKEIDVPVTTLRAIERGTKRISKELLAKISRTLMISADEIIGDSFKGG